MAERPGRGEFEVIAELLAPLGNGDPRALGFRDDAAVLPPRPDADTVVSTDTMVAGIHFPVEEDPEVVARRLLRVNLSDLAAMAATPNAYFLNLALPAAIGDSWLEGFARGLRIDQDRFAVTLLGGDITRTDGPPVLSITVVGELPLGQAVTRKGAVPGHLVMVSGTIGDAVLGLQASGEGAAEQEFLVQRFRLPEPRLALGRSLRGIATAMADVSDGLVADLGHICTASGVGARIGIDRVPVSEAAAAMCHQRGIGFAALVTGGDDYELVFTVAVKDRARALAGGREAGVDVVEIGTIISGSGTVSLVDADGRPVDVDGSGWRHF